MGIFDPAPFHFLLGSSNGVSKEKEKSRTKESAMNLPHDADAEKPAIDQEVRVWLADGSQEAAIWTGEVWWTYRGAVEVVKWQVPDGVPGNDVDDDGDDGDDGDEAN